MPSSRLDIDSKSPPALPISPPRLSAEQAELLASRFRPIWDEPPSPDFGFVEGPARLPPPLPGAAAPEAIRAPADPAAHLASLLQAALAPSPGDPSADATPLPYDASAAALPVGAPSLLPTPAQAMPLTTTDFGQPPSNLIGYGPGSPFFASPGAELPSYAHHQVVIRDASPADLRAPTIRRRLPPWLVIASCAAALGAFGFGFLRGSSPSAPGGHAPPSQVAPAVDGKVAETAPAATAAEKTAEKATPETVPAATTTVHKAVEGAAPEKTPNTTTDVEKADARSVPIAAGSAPPPASPAPTPRRGPPAPSRPTPQKAGGDIVREFPDAS